MTDLPSVIGGGRKKKEKDRTVRITTKKDGVLKIDHDKLRRLLIRPEIGEKPVAIISIVGEMRKGKSTALNFFARYLRNGGLEKGKNWMGDNDEVIGRDFKLKSGTDGCTKGIRILDEVFEVQMESGDKMAVLLMDTQGLFDHGTPERVNKMLLILTTLASSVQIFNTQSVINTQQLSYLKVCVDFALATANKGGGAYMRLQTLMFLIRDFSLSENYSEYGFDDGDRYWKTISTSNEGEDDQQALVMKGIQESFNKIRCFAMPHPGIDVTERNFSRRNQEFRPKFLKQVRDFVEGVASPPILGPKSSNEKPMTARELLNMITSCDNIFVDDIYDTAHLLEANIKAHYSAKYEEAYARYSEEMREYMQRQKEDDDKELEIKHEAEKWSALKFYDGGLEMGAGDVRKKYRRHLQQQCDNFHISQKDKLLQKKGEKEMKRLHNAQMGSLKYEIKMQVNCAGKEDDVFVKDHHTVSGSIFHEYRDSADMDTLNKGIGARFEKLRAENKKRREQLKEIQKNEDRKMKLHVLVHCDLRNQIMKRWEEGTKELLAEDAFETLCGKIEEEVYSAYWKGAFTAIETKYLEKLTEKLNKALEELKTTSNNDGSSKSASAEKRETDAKSDDSDSDEQETVQNTVESQPPTAEKGFLRKFKPLKDKKLSAYVRELTTEFKESLNKDDSQLTQKRKKASVEDKYCNRCSPEILHYMKELEYLLDTLHQEADIRNSTKLANLEVETGNKIANMISEIEDELDKVMSDRHKDGKMLQSYYEDVKTDMKQDIQKEFQAFQKTRETLETLLEDKLGKSYDKMNEKNKANRDLRAVRDTTEVPEKKNLFERFLDWIRGLIRRSK